MEIKGCHFTAPMIHELEGMIEGLKSSEDYSKEEAENSGKLISHIQEVIEELGAVSHENDLMPFRVKILYLRRATLNQRLSVEAGFLLITDGRDVLEAERRSAGYDLKEALRTVPHAEFEEIEKATKTERVIDDKLDVFGWLHLNINRLLLKGAGDNKPFIDQIQLIKVRKRSLRHQLNRLYAQKNSLVRENECERGFEETADLNKQLQSVKKSIRHIRDEKRRLHFSQVQIFVSRALEVYKRTKSKPLQDYIFKLQEEFKALYEYNPSSQNDLSLDPYHPKSILTPSELAFKVKTAEWSFSHDDRDLNLDELIKGVRAFLTWTEENPAQAQFMIKDLTLLVAALNDLPLTRDCAQVIDRIHARTQTFALPVEMVDDRHGYGQLSTLFRRLWVKSQAADERACHFFKECHLGSLISRIDLRGIDGRAPAKAEEKSYRTFLTNLAYLRRAMVPLLKEQVEQGIHNSDTYKKVVRQEFVKWAFDTAEESTQTRRPPKLRTKDPFSWNQVKRWIKMLVLGESTRERCARLAVLTIAGLSGGALLGGGIVVIFLHSGLAALAGPIMIGGAGGLFGFLYSSLNRFIDKWIESSVPEEDELRKKILSYEYYPVMREKGILPDYGPCPAFEEEDLPEVEALGVEIVSCLNPKDRPDVILETFKRVVNEGKLFEGRSLGIVRRAIHHVMDHHLPGMIRKSVKECLKQDHKMFHYPGEVESSRAYKRRILARMGFE